MSNHFTLGARVLPGAAEPEFPRSILDTPACYGLAGDFVRAVEPHTEADPVAILTQLLVAYGNIIGRRAHFRVEADKHHLNLFMALVGQSAKGRKGTSWGYVRNILDTVDSNWNENNVKNGLSSGEGLIKAISSRKSPDNSPPEDNADETIDKRLMVQEGEFASVLQMFKRDGNTLSPILRNLWDSGSGSILTRNDPLQVSGAHVSIVGHITQDELLRLLSSNEAANGFANRFLWVYARRSKRLPEGGNISEANLYSVEQRLQNAVKFGRQADQLRRDDEARQLWLEIYDELSAEHAGMLGSVTARAEAQTMRLACLYALLDCSPVVRKVHLAAAFALWNYCFDSARFIFGNSAGDPHVDKILTGLEEAGENGLTTTQISSLFGRNVSAALLRGSLDALKAEGRIQFQKKASKQGRPCEVWKLTPSPEEIPPEPEPVQSEPTSAPSESAFVPTTNELNEENESEWHRAFFQKKADEDEDDYDDYFSDDNGLYADDDDEDEDEDEDDDGFNSRRRRFAGYEEEAEY